MAKKALCIGINNYPGTQMDLRGCVNDAEDWATELASRGFTVKKLIDDKATKAAMVDAFKAIVQGAAPQDVVVITYSGHGTYVPDQNGDEADGFDEALCPYDIQTNNAPFIDDEIHAIFETRKPGVRVVLIADSCHSGTVTRAVATANPDDLPRPRFLPMGNWMSADKLPRTLARNAGTKAAARPSPFAKALKATESDLLLSGCQEGRNNFSYDAKIKGRPNGAFSYYALKTLKSLAPTATYADWHAAITPSYLPSTSYPQSPQIVGNAAARKNKVFS
jgi:hypothetical protein